MKRIRWIAGVLVILLVTGCVTVPSGPSVMVMPGSGQTFEQFQSDDAACRQWAQQQSGDAATSSDAANCLNAGVSVSFNRMYRPTCPSGPAIRNGMRQP